jgi:hypothetical protein
MFNAAPLPRCMLFKHVGLKTSLALVAMGVVASVLSAQSQNPNSVEPTASASEQYPPITLPDGTPIHLRFAQPVYGLAAVSRDLAVKRGSTVRMVVAADVRVGHRVVVAKGALAQASVASVWLPKNDARLHQYDPVVTGLSLKLDWATAVTGTRIPLRPLRNGHSKPFDVEVVSEKGGMEVNALRFSRTLLGPAMSELFSGKVLHMKMWIPDGARMSAFVDGDARFEHNDLDQAQTEMPLPNMNATLYIFRIKDKQGTSPPVACDDIESGSLAQRQMTGLDLTPGKHSCHVGPSPVAQLTMDGGNEYYLWLRRTGENKWELKQVSTEEGEDRSADAELLPPSPAQVAPQKP